MAVTSSCGSAVPPPASAPALAPGAVACAVWDREVEFARSVHDHDTHAFAEHVHAGAVFVESDKVVRGREAIVASWAPILRGEGLRLEWHPTSVELTGDPHVALSRGPFWIEITKPDAKNRFLSGVFQSVWVKDLDGVWRVMIDGGTPAAAATTEEELEKVKAAIPAQCPSSG